MARLYYSPIILATVMVLFTCKQSWGALRTCEPIRVTLCTDLGYNQTGLSNLGGSELPQADAEYYLATFSPLIQYGCSAHLKLFLCAVYVPMCTEKVANPIGPCRGLCESVRAGCYPVLQGFGFPWPDALNCSLFPETNNHEHMCMEGPREVGATGGGADATHFAEGAGVIGYEGEGGGGGGGGVAGGECPVQHVRTATGTCVPNCDEDILFDASEKRFAEVWVTVWALICFTCSLSAALTLSIGGGRVRARPLVSLALCYCALSAGWTIRMLAGRSTTTCRLPSGDIHELDGFGNASCATVALILYYFGMASNAWWVCMCGWWVARAGLSWSPEKLRNLGTFLHVVAWGLPAAQTAVAIARRDVDIDELTGTCSIGNRNTTTLLTLVLVPQAIYLSLGTVLLLTGSVHILRRPRQPLTITSGGAPLTGALPRKHSDILGALSTLYILPTACVLASVCYEYNNYTAWLQSPPPSEGPAVWAFLLRHLMSLFVGVSTVFWIGSRKTLTAWQAVSRRLGPSKPMHQVIKCQQQALVAPNVVRYHHGVGVVSAGGGSRGGGGGGGGLVAMGGQYVGGTRGGGGVGGTVRGSSNNGHGGGGGGSRVAEYSGESGQHLMASHLGSTSSRQSSRSHSRKPRIHHHHGGGGGGGMRPSSENII